MHRLLSVGLLLLLVCGLAFTAGCRTHEKVVEHDRVIVRDRDGHDHYRRGHDYDRHAHY